MPGTYAPPAVELPKTSAIVGCLRADARVRSRKSLPPGMKISFCVGRSAPPDSTSEIVGRLFSSAICEARNAFLTVHGLEAPPFTVGSLAVTRHSTPSTTPIPVTSEAPMVKSEPQPASGDSSRNAEPGSRSSSIRSRAVSLPRAWWRSSPLPPLLHPRGRRPHPPPVRTATQRPEDEPVEPGGEVGVEPEVLGDQRPAVRRLEPVAPVVDGDRVAADRELEDLLGLAGGDLAEAPVGRADAVALHVALEVGAHRGPGRAAGPPRLERLRAELTDP